MPNCLLFIDPQRDFVDEGGPMRVPHADQDTMRMCNRIEVKPSTFDEIVLSGDDHPRIHISHPGWFAKLEDDSHPLPFTQIKTILSSKLIRFESSDGAKYDSLDDEWTACYIETMEAKGHPHIIWPEHCIAGTLGAAFSAHVNLEPWERCHRNSIKQPRIVRKGQCPFVEQHGIFGPEVMHPDFPKETGFNWELMMFLSQFEVIFVAGQASTHCVPASVYPMVDFFYKNRYKVGKIVLLKDAMSPVPGFEQQEESFFTAMQGYGGFVELAKTTEI
jgi:nicotinamidase-related amidase